MSIIRQGHVVFGLFASIVLVSSLAQADTITFSGSFNQDDNVQLFNITQSTTNNLTVYTSSYATGGFTPVLSLFDGLGNFVTADNGSQNSGCNALLSNDTTNTSACWDAIIVFPGAPGSSYILALTQDDNTFSGAVLTDGFSETGNGNFTGVNSGYGGSFRLADGTQRTADWTLNILSADPQLSAAEVPEPASGVLLLNGLAIVAGTIRRKRSAQ